MATTDTLIINRILGAAAERRASDLHLSAGNYPVMRINDELVPLEGEEVITPDFVQQLVEFFIPEDKREEFNKNKEILLIHEWMNQLRLKVAIFYQKNLPVVAIHIIPEVVPELRSLGLPQGVDNLINSKKGLLLIGGTFGSGRSTTAAVLLNTINAQRKERILTIEEPIEFLLANNQSMIAQQEVGKDIVSRRDGLAQAMNQDIDVLFVSEVSDWEEWELVLKHAEAGRLVLVVMTAESSTLALERIINAYPEDKQNWARELLANHLEAVLIQRLLPRVGGGLAMASELLFNNQAVAGSIKENKLYQIFSILQSNRDMGMLALDQSLLELVRTGEVAKEDALPEVIDKVNFNNSLKKF
ncbi:MAG: type IV pilus twitching motility protein PilT [Candidatus Komeilibacteria bacterium]